MFVAAGLFLTGSKAFTIDKLFFLFRCVQYFSPYRRRNRHFQFITSLLFHGRHQERVIGGKLDSINPTEKLLLNGAPYFIYC